MAETKESLVRYFSGLDVATLQKLKKYSEMIMIPEEDLLTNVTMIQMVDKAHELANIYFPEWTDRSKSDFGEFLVELMALFSEKDFWYINAVANESTLRKMHSYSNAFTMASSLGYQAATYKGAEANFEVSFEEGDTIVYSRGDLILLLGDHTFTNDEAFEVLASNAPTTKTLTLREGKQLYEDVVYNGYSIQLVKPRIDLDSITVTIGGIAYTRVNNFGNSGIESSHFLVLPEENGSCSIFFGSEGFGMQPAFGASVHIEYRQCNGLSGNAPIGSVTVNDSLDDRKATAATMLTDATKGTTAATLTEIKERSMSNFRSRQALINEEVTEAAINSMAFIKRSNVEVSANVVSFQAIPLSGNPEPSVAEISEIIAEVSPYLLAGYDFVNAANNYVNIVTAQDLSAQKMVVEAIVSRGYDAASISASIKQIISDLTNPLVNAEYGKGFSKADTDILIRTQVPGVQSTAFKLLIGGSRVVMDDIELASDTIFQTIDLNDLIVNVYVY